MIAAWPFETIHRRLDAVYDTAWQELIQVLLPHDDPSGSVVAYWSAELAEVGPDSVLLALTDDQRAAGLDRPYRVELLADICSGVFGRRIEVVILNASTHEGAADVEL